MQRGEQFGRVSKSKNKKNTDGKIENDKYSEPNDFGKIIVAKVEATQTNNLQITKRIQQISQKQRAVTVEMIADSGVSKTLLNYKNWLAIRGQCKIVKRSKGFRPYTSF